MNMCCLAKNHDCFSCHTCSKPKVGCRSCLICISCTDCVNKKCDCCKIRSYKKDWGFKKTRKLNKNNS